MAKILFSVCGVGMGHATRSSVLIKALMKDHKVFISSYNSAYKFLKSEINEGQELKWFELLFNEHEYKKIKTMLYNAPKAPRVVASNIYHLAKFVRKFKPDIIISDFDANSVFVGELFNVPVVTISSMHIMEYIKPKLSLREKIYYYSTEKPVLAAFGTSNYLFITYYFKPGVNYAKRQFFGPIVREKFITERVTDGGHHLVYLSEAEAEKIIPVLKKFRDERFLVYGTNKNFVKDNIEFCAPNDDNFYRDFMNCSSVFTHGGISLTSEAVITKKPIYAFAPKEFYERYFNGTILKKLGFGALEELPTAEGVSSFLGDREMYRKEMRKADLPPGNREIIRALKKVIEKETEKKK